MAHDNGRWVVDAKARKEGRQPDSQVGRCTEALCECDSVMEVLGPLPLHVTDEVREKPCTVENVCPRPSSIPTHVLT